MSKFIPFSKFRFKVLDWQWLSSATFRWLVPVKKLLFYANAFFHSLVVDKRLSELLLYYCPTTVGQNEAFLGSNRGTFYLRSISFFIFLKSINFACFKISIETWPFVDITIHRFLNAFRYLIKDSKSLSPESKTKVS